MQVLKWTIFAAYGFVEENATIFAVFLFDMCSFCCYTFHLKKVMA